MTERFDAAMLEALIEDRRLRELSSELDKRAFLIGELGAEGFDLDR